MEWQPIETAPKDGTVVDLWVDGLRCTDCAWRMPEKWGEGVECWCGVVRDFYAAGEDVWYDIEAQPTHWMPLPEPPK